MSNIYKKLLIPTLGLAALVSVGIITANAVSAQDGSYPPFVQSLAERFGLDQGEVQSFFDEQKQQKLELMNLKKDERLDQAVEDGVITDEQKQALLDRWEEMKTQQKEGKEEIQTWFEEQGIDSEALHLYGGFGHKRFGFKHWGK